MKPPVFDYHAPRTIDEALALLERYGDDAKILAGGQSLVPLLNFRLTRPAALIDINGISGLAYVRDDEGLRLGAMTRQRTIEGSALVRERIPLLQEATRLIGHLPIRTRGTIGGSLAHADPAAEYPALVTALDGELVMRSVNGERRLQPREFFVTYLSTAIRPNELLIEVRLPASPPRSGWAFEEFSRRAGDFALVAVAALVTSDGGRCRAARLAAAGGGPVPVRLEAAESILEGSGLTDASIEAAAEAAAELVTPESDIHASAAYRRQLTRVLTRRALRRARERAETAHHE